MLNVEIQSFNGIGDLLFVTPTLMRIKEAYPDSNITVNTNYPELLDNNPYIDRIGNIRQGVVLSYPDPIHCKEPTEHHILSDWRIVCKAYGIQTQPPVLRPILNINIPPEDKHEIGIQTMHKGHWHRKKVWPFFDQLACFYEPIPKMPSITHLVRKIANYKVVVCSEGGISHIAKALGTRAIVIYGGWCNPEWNGYPDQMNVVNKLDCSYCYNSYPCKGDYQCLNQISLTHIRNLISEAVRCS